MPVVSLIMVEASRCESTNAPLTASTASPTSSLPEVAPSASGARVEICSSASSSEVSVMPRRDDACGLAMDTTLTPSATWAAVSVGATPAADAPSSTVVASATGVVGAAAAAAAGGGNGMVRRGATGGATRLGCTSGL